jgi:hypothetical protein
MLVRDAGDAWQVVLQPDHAVLSEQLCRAWGNDELVAPRPAEVLATAARRHDDGWAVWEQSPGLDRGGEKPRGFLEVEVPLHLAFYRAAIAAVTDEDAYAGLLVSMHGAGIYQERYGAQPGMRLTFQHEVQEQVDAFVSEQEAGYPARISEVGVDDEERWVNYRLLQVYDRLSLYFCLRDVAGGEADALDHVPTDYAGGETELAIEPAGPWHVSIDPFPFGGGEAGFTLDMRVLPKQTWASDAHFRADFFAAPVERQAITISAA